MHLPRSLFCLFLVACSASGAPVLDALDPDATRCLDPETLRMCRLELRARSKNPDFRVLGMEAEGELRYTGHGREDTSGPLRWKGRGDRLILDFGSRFQGGAFDFRYRTEVRRPRGAAEWTPWKEVHRLLLGRNPSPQLVRVYAASLPVQVCVFALSGFRMFDEDGWPFHARGFGIAQLEYPTPRQVWDWQANLDAGIAAFEAAERTARRWPSLLRKEGLAVPDFSEEQVRAAAYQLLGDGRSYWEPDPDGAGWIRNPATGGFADRCLALEARVLAGDPPAGWD